MHVWIFTLVVTNVEARTPSGFIITIIQRQSHASVLATSECELIDVIVLCTAYLMMTPQRGRTILVVGHCATAIVHGSRPSHRHLTIRLQSSL